MTEGVLYLVTDTIFTTEITGFTIEESTPMPDPGETYREPKADLRRLRVDRVAATPVRAGEEPCDDTAVRGEAASSTENEGGLEARR